MGPVVMMLQKEREFVDFGFSDFLLMNNPLRLSFLREYISWTVRINEAS